MSFDPRKFHINQFHKEFKPKAKIQMHANVELIGFDARIIPTYAAYLQLKKMAQVKDALAYLKFLDIYRKAIIHYEKSDNLVVSAGANWLASIITNTGLGGGPTNFLWCRVGSSGQAVSAGDTDVISLIGSSVSVTYPYTVANVAHFDTFFTAANTWNGTWQETALASQSAPSDATHPILARKVLTSFAKNTTNTAMLAWSITFTPV